MKLGLAFILGFLVIAGGWCYLAVESKPQKPELARIEALESSYADLQKRVEGLERITNSKNGRSLAVR